LTRLTLPALPDPVPAEPLKLATLRVMPSWIDYNGHMTEGRYLLACTEATDVLLHLIGVDPGYVAAGRSYYTVETHILHLGESRAGDLLTGTLQVLAADEKRLHVFVLFVVEGRPIASLEQMLLHVDAEAGRAVAADRAVLDRLQALAEAHAALPRPRNAGRCVGERRR
jgi:carnitine 3-dehydrogenase